MANISPEHKKIIFDIIDRFVPHCEIRIYGSRYRNTAKKFSDLDISLASDRVIDWIIIEKIKEAFQESTLPYRVDVSDWHSLSPEFQKVIETSGYEVLKI